MLNDKFLFQNLIQKILEDNELLKICPPIIENWENNHFEWFADAISNRMVTCSLISREEKDKLGTTISLSTLKRLLKSGTIPEQIRDKRHINSLSKLAIFAGFKNWHSFKYSVMMPKSGIEPQKIIEFKQKVETRLDEAIVIMPSLKEFESQVKQCFSEYEIEIDWGSLTGEMLKEYPESWNFGMLMYHGGGNVEYALSGINGKIYFNGIQRHTIFVNYAFCSDELNDMIEGIFNIRSNFYIPNHLRLVGIFCSPWITGEFPEKYDIYHTKDKDTELWLLYVADEKNKYFSKTN